MDFIILNNMVQPVITKPEHLMHCTKVELNNLSKKYIGTPIEKGTPKEEAATQLYAAIVNILNEAKPNIDVGSVSSKGETPNHPLQNKETPEEFEKATEMTTETLPGETKALPEETVTSQAPPEIKTPPKPAKDRVRSRKRAPKTYSFLVEGDPGHLTAAGEFDDKNDPILLTDIKESIEFFIEEEQKKSFTAKEIMVDVVENGKFDFSQSQQEPEKLFQRNVPALKASGWIAE